MARGWRYSRKAPDWNAYGPKLRVTREPMPDVTKTATLKGESDASWRVEFDDEEGTFFVSKRFGKIERVADSLRVEITMPPWLWEKMAEEGGR